MDGPFHELTKINPVFRRQWDQDRQLGPTYVDRRNELNKLRGQMAAMDASEQEKWLNNLQLLLEHDPSPDMRRDAVLCLKGVDHPNTMQVLNVACQDESDKVRIAACEVLGDRLDPQSIVKLGELAQADEDLSVRVASIRNLGNSTSEDARRFLAQTIQDKSPSIQYETTLALQKNTGKSLGPDVAMWRKYLNGEPVEEPSFLATQWSEWFGSKR